MNVRPGMAWVLFCTMLGTAVARGATAPPGPELRAYVNESCIVADEPWLVPPAERLEGDQSALRCRATGTHTGDAMGVPPTGKKVLFTAMIWTRWKDGKIIEGWNEVDMWGLMQQIAPPPPAHPTPQLKAL